MTEAALPVPPAPARPRRVLSLRARLLAGAGLIALICIGAAALGAWAAEAMNVRVAAAAGAQARLEMLGTLSARINDYALVAIEAAARGDGAGRQRIASRAEVVRDTFRKTREALAAAVDEARAMGEREQMARATRSIGLARMQAEFDALDRRLDVERLSTAGLRSQLDAFATRFSPLLDQQIAEERRARQAAYEAVRQLSRRMVLWAAAVAVAAVLALAVFARVLVHPLLARLSAFGDAARAIGGGRPGVRLPTGRRDEIGLAATQLNLMAGRLDRRAETVAADRQRLEQTIAERTAALRAANEKLARIDASRRRFFADVGHELRTPLTVIRAEAELGAGGAGDAETVASFNTILTRTRRLNRRIDDLLRVARSETGRIELAEAPFDLSRAAAEAIEDAAGIAARRRIALELDAPQPVGVSGDGDWTRQVIAGLLDNAIRHAPDGSRIAIVVTAADGAAEVAVEDEGPGVPPERREAIFQRFDRGANAAEGFGIGLALARWIVGQQGGTIVCEDRPDGARGAQFRIRLPLEAPA